MAPIRVVSTQSYLLPATATSYTFSVSASANDVVVISASAHGGTALNATLTAPSGTTTTVVPAFIGAASNASRIHTFVSVVSTGGNLTYTVNHANYSKVVYTAVVVRNVDLTNPVLQSTSSMPDSNNNSILEFSSFNISSNDALTFLFGNLPNTSSALFTDLDPSSIVVSNTYLVGATAPSTSVSLIVSPSSGAYFPRPIPLNTPVDNVNTGVAGALVLRPAEVTTPTTLRPTGIAPRSRVGGPQLVRDLYPFVVSTKFYDIFVETYTTLSLDFLEPNDLVFFIWTNNNTSGDSAVSAASLTGVNVNSITNYRTQSATGSNARYQIWTARVSNAGSISLTMNWGGSFGTASVALVALRRVSAIDSFTSTVDTTRDTTQALGQVSPKNTDSTVLQIVSSRTASESFFTFPSPLKRLVDPYSSSYSSVSTSAWGIAFDNPNSTATTSYSAATISQTQLIGAHYAFGFAFSPSTSIRTAQYGTYSLRSVIGDHTLVQGPIPDLITAVGWTRQPTGFGQARVVSLSQIKPPSISSVGSSGYHALAPKAGLSPSGIAPTSVFTKPELYAKAADTQTISTVRITPVATGWGNATLFSQLSITARGIPSTAAVSALHTVGEKRTINAALIVPRTVEFGTARLRDPAFTREIVPKGLHRSAWLYPEFIGGDFPESLFIFGRATIDVPFVPGLYLTGIPSASVFGRPAVVDPTIRVRTSIPRRTAVGRPTLGPAGAIAPQGIVARSVISAPAARSASSTLDRITSLVVPRGRAVRKALPTTGGTKYLVVDAITRQVQCELQLTGVSYGFEQNQAGGFEGSISLYDPRVQFLAAQRSFIVVERGGRPFWVGFLWQLQREGKQLQIVAQEIWSIFGNRKVRDSLRFLSLDRAAAINFLVSYAQRGLQGDLGIDPTVDAASLTGDTFSWVVNWFDRKSVKEVVDTIVSVDPFIFRFEPYWTANSKLDFRLIIDPVYPKPSPHSLIYESNVDDYSWATATPSPNFIDAFGAGEGEAQLRTTSYYSPASSPFIRVEGDVSNDKISKRSVLSRLATSELRRVGGIQDLQGMTMSAAADPVLGTLMPGTKVRGVVSDGGIQVDEDFVVNTINVTVPDASQGVPGTETVEIGFGQLPAETDEYEEGFLFKDNPGVLGIDITGKPTGYAENPILCNCQHPSHGKPYT